MRELNRLYYLDISNNQLTGLFPEWIHSLTRLELLNLGQNYFSGDIPLVISGRLNNLRVLFTNAQNIPSIGQKLMYLKLRQSYRTFFRANFPWMKRSKDLLWVDPHGSWNDIKFPQVLDAYLKAEANHLTATVFQNIRRDPARIVEFVESARTRPSLM